MKTQEQIKQEVTRRFENNPFADKWQAKLNELRVACPSREKVG